MATETITLKLVAQDLMSGNVSKAIGSLDKLAQRGGLVGSVVQGVGQQFGQMLNPIGLVTRGIGMLTDTLGDSIKAFNEDALSQKKLQTALEANIEGWDGNTKAIEDLIASRMRLGFSDDQQRENLALLVAQIGDVNDALAVQRTAMDLARLKGIGLADAAGVLAKAYNGSTTALQKMGIKLDKGVKGLEAVDAVQQRVAGQAKAYADTMVGSAEVMAISFDEFKESVGGALTGALTPFFNLVVDLTNQTPDLDSALGKLTQQYRDLIETKAEAIKQNDAWDDEVTSFLQGVFMPQDKAIHDLTETMGNYQLILGVTRKDLALFAEAGMTVGKSTDDIRKALDMLVAQHVQGRSLDIGYAWQTGMDDIQSSSLTAADIVGDAMGTISRSTTRAIDKSLTTLADMKGPWKEAWKEYAQYAKNPFRPAAFEKWMEKRADKAAQNAIDAAKEGRPRAAKRWQELADAMRDPVIRALTQINGSVTESLGIIARFKQQTAGLANIIPAIGSVFGNDKDGGVRHLPNGVEQRATANSANSATVNVTVIGSMSEADGQRFARVVTPHINREMARSGR